MVLVGVGEDQPVQESALLLDEPQVRQDDVDPGSRSSAKPMPRSTISQRPSWP